jgi:regulator of protease activity HflC (stomatin/prohibitin superfamily)
MFFSPYAFYVISIVVVVTLVLIAASVRVLREYERAVVFTLGRFQKVKGPGLVLLVPFFQEMVRVDLRIQVIEIPTQDVISRDNVSMKVDAALYFNVVNPERAIIQVQSYLPATNMLAQTTHYQAVRGDDSVPLLPSRNNLRARVHELRPHDDRQDPTEDPGRRRKDQIKRADILVIGTEKPPPRESRRGAVGGGVFPVMRGRRHCHPPVQSGPAALRRTLCKHRSQR